MSCLEQQRNSMTLSILSFTFSNSYTEKQTHTHTQENEVQFDLLNFFKTKNKIQVKIQKTVKPKEESNKTKGKLSY